MYHNLYYVSLRWWQLNHLRYYCNGITAANGNLGYFPCKLDFINCHIRTKTINFLARNRQRQLDDWLMCRVPRGKHRQKCKVQSICLINTLVQYTSGIISTPRKCSSIFMHRDLVQSLNSRAKLLYVESFFIVDTINGN